MGRQCTDSPDTLRAIQLGSLNYKLSLGYRIAITPSIVDDMHRKLTSKGGCVGWLRVSG